MTSNKPYRFILLFHQLSYLIAIAFWSFPKNITGLDNGVALTPPMGWMSWERFRCVTDCADAPNECLNEKLIMEMADALVANGFANAGYHL